MSYTHTFSQSESGKTFRLTVSDPQNNSDSILINIFDAPITPSGEFGSFPQGTTSDEFCLICQLNEDYRNSLNAADLNQYAYHYLQNIGIEVEPNTTFYGSDSNGIYVFIEKTEGLSCSNQVVNINGKDCYKVYIGGPADIIAYQRNQQAIGRYELQLSNGLYNMIDDVLYLFIVDSAKLVYLLKESGVPVAFYYNGETVADAKYFTDNNIYLEGGYYISIGADCTVDTIAAPSTTDINYVFSDGNISAIVTSDTMTELDHFADIVNAEKIILSTNIKRIGDYCFYGSSVSGTIVLETSVLEEIGDYAFSGMSNLKLLNINASEDGYSNFPKSLIKIGDHAFDNASGLNKISLIECTNLIEVGINAFANCGNLRFVNYLKTQIEPDDRVGTQLIYLPPERGTDGNYAPRTTTTERTTVTTGYLYNYESSTAYPCGSLEISNSTYTFLNCSNISWLCE